MNDVFLTWSHGKDDLEPTLQYSGVQWYPPVNELHHGNRTEQLSLRFLDVFLTRNSTGFLIVTVFFEKIPLSKMQDNSIIQKSNPPFVVPQYSALIQYVTSKVSEMN